MAQVTPKEILEISEPIEAIYQRTIDELLINIAHHFNITGWERTRFWEIKKLSEMGALTKESAAIIANNTQMLPDEIEKAFLEVAEKACKDIDPQLKKAAKEGLLQDPMTSPSTSVLMRDMVQAYVDQAVDKTNMVNTTMLESTRNAYLKGITTAVNEAQLLEAKQALESGALAVTTGVETRTMAIRKAMNAIANTGIAGFYDKRGRAWSADAYSAMVIRTTAHNAAIEAVKTRQQEFGGGDIFQVSSHPGARPLCFPYQGKFFSWSDGPGEFTDGAGQTHKYDNINNTSYGQAAGLFGINCGHHPIPIIPGFSYPQDGPKQTKEENDKEYKESQIQRQYERNIRTAKRDLEVAKATGDTEMIEEAKQKVAQEQAKIRTYVTETDRPRRYDREQIAGAPIPQGYRGYMAERNSDYPEKGSKWTKEKKPKNDYTYSNKVVAPADKYSGKTVLTNTDKSDTISSELFRKADRSRSKEGYKYISDKRFDNITASARKNGAIIIRGTEEVEKHLDKANANASNIGDALLFREKVTISEVLEELRHFEQNRIGMNADKPYDLREVLNEIDAKEYLLENTKKYKISRIETEETKKLLKEHLAELEKLRKKYDE